MSYGGDSYAQEKSGVPYWSDDYMRGQAAKKNLDVMYDDDNTLLLDIDVPFDTFVAEQQVYKIGEKLEFLEGLGVAEFDVGLPQVLRSKSGNTHVIVKLADAQPSVMTRVFLQALLGSDLKRAALSYAGVIHGQEHPNVLFRPRAETPESFVAQSTQDYAS